MLLHNKCVHYYHEHPKAYTDHTSEEILQSVLNFVLSSGFPWVIDGRLSQSLFFECLAPLDRQHDKGSEDAFPPKKKKGRHPVFELVCRHCLPIPVPVGTPK
jgi:hypothetical protein